MDATRFAAVLTIAFVLSPLAGFAEDDAGTDAAKIVKEAIVLKKAGKKSESRKLLREAIVPYEEHIKQNPNDAQALLALSRLQIPLNHVAAAKDNLERAISLDPQCAAMHESRGDMHMAFNELPEAIKSYRRAVELDPKNAEVRAQFALCLAQQDEMDEALAQAREAVKLDPASKWTLGALATVLVASAQVEEWEQTIRIAIKLHPGEQNLRESLVSVLTILQRHEEAYREGLELQKLDPVNPERDAELVALATQAKQSAAAELHLARLRELRKEGKYSAAFVAREEFNVNRKKILAKEFFEKGSGNTFTKLEFAVYDQEEKLDMRVFLATHEPTNESLRRDGKLRETERAYALTMVRRQQKQHLGTFTHELSYERARSMVVEIIDGAQPAERFALPQPLAPLGLPAAHFALPKISEPFALPEGQSP